jgi:hypothetical protein
MAESPHDCETLAALLVLRYAQQLNRWIDRLRSQGEAIASIIGIIGSILPITTVWWRVVFLVLALGALVDGWLLRPSVNLPLSKLRASTRILISIGIAITVSALLWRPLFNEYRTEHPIPSLVYIAPAVWLPQAEAWYMRIMHYGPNPVYNIQIEFVDEDRNAQLSKQRGGITSKQLEEAQTSLTYPEIDPERGLILNRQFLWSPLDPSREHYRALISTRDGGFAESIRIARVNSKWRFQIIVNDNPTSRAAIINCRDPDLADGAVSDRLPPCFPTYTTIPGPDSTSLKWSPRMALIAQCLLLCPSTHRSSF